MTIWRGKSMMEKNKISVIVPFYNADKWLCRCLDSIVNQTIFNETEIILIDDGSQDNSGSIADSFADKYQNIICKHIENGGVSNARNMGLKMSKGEYVTFVDADDYIDDIYLENMRNHMESNIDIVCSGYIAEYKDKSVTKAVSDTLIFDKNEAVKHFLLGDNIDPQINDKMFRKSVLEDLFFDTSIAIAEDKLFLFNCIKKADSLIILPTANYHYTMNDTSAVRKEMNDKKLQPLKVIRIINSDIKENFPHLTKLSESAMIDVACRIYGDIYGFKAVDKYRDEYRQLKKEIAKFSILDKYKYSSKKHFFAFCLAKIHPALYCFFKNDLKLQYK